MMSTLDMVRALHINAVGEGIETDAVAVDVFVVDPRSEREQVLALERLKATRNGKAVLDGLEAVRLSAAC